jgi:5-methylthioadenosine/S-adenosylhomocysteine deaminase
VTAPSIEDGAVLVDDGGRITAVGPNDQVPAPKGVQSLEFTDGELMPGLVNCHTHLELTQLGGGRKHVDPEFHKWIWHVRTLKDATSAEAFYEAAVAGVRDCWARGVTCIAETGSTGAVMRALHDLGARGIVYHETFGPDPAQCVASMRELEAAVLQLRRLVTAKLVLGVSPHAPYSVSAPLYHATAEFARRERLPIAVHIAESQAETELVRDGTGPFATLFGARSIPVGHTTFAGRISHAARRPGGDNFPFIACRSAKRISAVAVRRRWADRALPPFQLRAWAWPISVRAVSERRSPGRARNRLGAQHR